ncbi:MAG TPA: CpaE-like family protein [Candidatus Stackebrandtia faecavium]|nr:CpaE-like family protein [Candidatus Stackebrandtia faecavium]
MDHHEGRALFVTNDESIAVELARLAAAAGARAWRSYDIVSAREYWTDASTVVLAPEAAADCERQKLPRRDNVIVLTGPALEAERAWSLAAAIGADQVINLPDAATWLTQRLGPRRVESTQGRAVIISGARGGVGASVLAATLGLRATANGRATLLVDGDRRGGGLDLALGWENLEGLRWNDLAGSAGPFDPQRLKTSLPSHNGLALLSYDRHHDTRSDPDLAVAVIAAARQVYDQIIIDLPRYCDDWIDQIAHAGDSAILVIPSEVRAVTASRQVIARYARHCSRVELVLRGPSPGRLRARDIQKATGLPLTAQIRTDPRLASAAETGAMAARSRRGNLAAVCDTLLNRLSVAAPATGGMPAEVR